MLKSKNRKTVLDALTGWLVFEFQREGFRFDRSIGRYRDNRTGRLVAESRVIEAADGFAEFTRANMQRITERYINGSIGVREWQQAMRQEIKDGFIVNATAGRGGRAQMTQSDWGRVGARLRQQYGYLDGLAWEREGGQVSDAQLRARAKMYATAERTAYFDGKTAAMQDAEFTEERRVLNPAEHCADCVAYAGLGWVPIGTLPEPGQASQCLSNCKCNKEYRTAAQIEET